MEILTETTTDISWRTNVTSDNSSRGRPEVATENHESFPWGMPAAVCVGVLWCRQFLLSNQRLVRLILASTQHGPRRIIKVKVMGPVVQKPVNAIRRLKVNQGFCFSC